MDTALATLQCVTEPCAATSAVGPHVQVVVGDSVVAYGARCLVVTRRFALQLVSRADPGELFHQPAGSSAVVTRHAMPPTARGGRDRFRLPR
jgi:hypothetical protein